MDEPTVYLNGRWSALSEAKVSVLDRGFIFGDGAYDVVPVYGRKPLRLEGHLQRLARNLQTLRIANPHDQAGWTELVREAIACNAPEDQSVYLHVTRGVAPRDPAFPVGVRPTVFVMANPSAAPPRALVTNGVECTTAQDNRWDRCDLKTIALLANCLLRQVSADAGAFETLLLRDGSLTEGSSSNVYVVKDGRIATPPRTHAILPGITLELVFDLARDAGLVIDARPVGEPELRAADEIWISSASKEVLAVTRLDGERVGTGEPGRIYRRLRAKFDEVILLLKRPSTAA